MEDYPYSPFHRPGPCYCGTCQAIYQRHNEFQKCVCRGCQERSIIPIHQPKWENKVSTLNICDRCETPATSNAMGSFTKRLSLSHGVESLELCPGCVTDFVAFMAGKGLGEIQVQDRPKAYKTPYVEPEERGSTDSLRETLLAIMSGKDEGDTKEYTDYTD